jgi:hypothetical protein
MSPAQCRAARAFLKWTQRNSPRPGCRPFHVVDFELKRRQVSVEKVQAIRIALELAGAMFGSNGSVKLRKGKSK